MKGYERSPAARRVQQTRCSRDVVPNLWPDYENPGEEESLVMGTKCAAGHLSKMRRLPLLFIAAVVLLSADCQATGMGWIPSAADPTQKATFGFVFAYDGTTYSFSGAYHDKAAGVDLKGSGVLKKTDPPNGKGINGV